MIELGAMKRDSIVKLCEDSRISLVRAAAEGKGRAFVPTLESPSCCLVLTGGFSYLVGMPRRGLSGPLSRIGKGVRGYQHTRGRCALG